MKRALNPKKLKEEKIRIRRIVIIIENKHTTRRIIKTKGCLVVKTNKIDKFPRWLRKKEKVQIIDIRMGKGLSPYN